MRYYPLYESPFWVEVAISKIGGSVPTRKYRGDGLVSVASGPDFRTELIHATITGPEEYEPVDGNK